MSSSGKKTDHTHVEADVTSLTADLAAKLSKSDATGKGGLWVATGTGSYNFHPAGNDGEVPIWDSFATDGVRNAVLSHAKALNDIIEWSIDPATCNGGAALAAATMTVVRVPLRRRQSITNLIAALTTNGSGLTNSFFVALDSTGAFLGRTSDYSANWVSGGTTVDGNAGGVGTKVMPISGGPVGASPLAADDFVYVCGYVGAIATTAPQFAKGAGSAISAAFLNVGTSAARTRFGTIAQTNTSTPGTIVPANLAQAINPFCFGIS